MAAKGYTASCCDCGRPIFVCRCDKPAEGQRDPDPRNRYCIQCWKQIVHRASNHAHGLPL